MGPLVNIKIHSGEIRAPNLKAFDHQIGYFDSSITQETADFIAQLVLGATHGAEKSILSFCPIDEERWDSLGKSGWTTLIRQPERREGPLGWRRHWSWIAGYADTQEALANQIRFAWNISGNESVSL
jgi:hypothetical protein